MALFNSCTFLFADIFIKQMAAAAVKWDRGGNFGKRPCERNTAHPDALVAAITNCGLCFQIGGKRMQMARGVECLTLPA